MEPSMPGIHHITAITSDPQENIDFYMGLLGLRLVKLTVNFDDPGAYHLYFGDDVGRPGTILTFFAWPGAPRGRQGTGEITAIAFLVPEGSLSYWSEWLAARGLSVEGPITRFDEQVLAFTDLDGLPLELVAHQRAAGRSGWSDGPIPAEHAIRGFAGVTLSLAEHAPTAALLAEVMGFRALEEDAGRLRYQIGDDTQGARIDLLATHAARRGAMGAGTVHHIAWRTPDDEQQLIWRQTLLAHGLQVTPVRDRQYFHSIYYREPGGVLFEIATDPPGFTTDETPEELGTHLKLPPWLEPQRALLERQLPPVHLPTKAVGE
jgi:glyoxalase family protein